MIKCIALIDMFDILNRPTCSSGSSIGSADVMDKRQFKSISRGVGPRKYQYIVVNLIGNVYLELGVL